MSIYIPNMKPEQFYNLCKEHGLEIIAASVPEHGDLIDRDALGKDIDNYIGGEESRSRFHHWVQVQSVVIPGDKEEEA